MFGADSRWSDLPMSGSFVEMLRRLVDMSGYTQKPGAGVASEATNVETVAPLRTLDGFGAFGPPPSTAKPMPADYRDAPHQIIRRASMAQPKVRLPSTRWLQPIASPHSTPRRCAPGGATYTNATARPARHPAVVLAGAVPDRCDRGRHAGRRPCRAVAATRGARGTAVGADPGRDHDRASPLSAADNDDFAIKSVSQTRLAYVVTGNADVDSIVKAGLSGLTLFLAQRTALEAGDPVGVDPRATNCRSSR